MLGYGAVRALLLAASLAAGCTAPATGPSGDGPGGGAAGAPDGGSADAGGELESGDAFLGRFFPIAADYQPHRFIDHFDPDEIHIDELPAD